MKAILCPNRIAKQPYHLKSIDLHFYSLEEILYFYNQHEILIDRSLMEESFVFWVRESLHCQGLAQKLHQMIAGKSSMTMFMEAIVNQTNYFEKEEREIFLEKISRFEDKNEFERRKVLADQMMEREKYEAAIIEYRRILNGKKDSVKEDVLLARVWHNLGCCYGRMLLLEQAMECFKTAYSYQQLSETQDAVAFLIHVNEQMEQINKVQEDSFVHLIEQTGQGKKDSHYAQLKQRMQEYIRRTL